MELARHLRGPQHVDVRGQLVIQGTPQRLGGEAGLDVEVGHLLQGVDTGVGAPGPVALEVGAASDAADGLVERPLHRPGVLLRLPARVTRAHVLEVEAEAGHGRTLSVRTHRVKRCYSGPAA